MIGDEYTFGDKIREHSSDIAFFLQYVYEMVKFGSIPKSQHEK